MKELEENPWFEDSTILRRPHYEIEVFEREFDVGLLKLVEVPFVTVSFRGAHSLQSEESSARAHNDDQECV